MKAYEIWDGENNRSIGILQYYEKEKNYIIELQEDLDEWTAPLLFTSFVCRGIYTIPRQESFLWVKERVIPSGRQNIGDILSNHKIMEYDEQKILEISRGKCSQDSLYIKKIDRLPAYVIERRKRNLVDCCMCAENEILCFFADDMVKKFSLEQIKNIDGIDKVMKNQLLFESGKVGTGGYCLTFNESIDVAANLLYEMVEDLPLRKKDFEAFVEKNVWDTSETCKALDCTRQNVSYLLNKNELTPIKKDVKGNLYLKGAVLKQRW